MKRVAIALVVLIVLIVAVGYNVWRANQEPVTSPPSELELGRQKLHAQIDDATKAEQQIEQQDWNSPALLEGIIKAHEQRIERLKDNSQASEIVAHDRAAIDRLQKRITELRAQAAAQAEIATTAAADARAGEEPKPQSASPARPAAPAESGGAHATSKPKPAAPPARP